MLGRRLLQCPGKPGYSSTAALAAPTFQAVTARAAGGKYACIHQNIEVDVGPLRQKKPAQHGKNSNADKRITQPKPAVGALVFVRVGQKLGDMLRLKLVEYRMMGNTDSGETCHPLRYHIQRLLRFISPHFRLFSMWPCSLYGFVHRAR